MAVSYRYAISFLVVQNYAHLYNSLKNGDAQELDLGTSSEDEEPAPKKPRPKKSKVKAADGSSESDESDTDSDEERVTAANFEARARALDEQAILDAELDAEELRQAALGDASGEELDDLADVAADGDDAGEGDGEGFVLPSAEDREAERKSGAQDLVEVQHRMRQCARVLSNFKRFSAKDRYV